MAGDVARSTGNLKLAMEYVGDTDHLKEAASVMDRERPDRTHTVPEPGAGSEAGLELVGTGGCPSSKIGNKVLALSAVIAGGAKNSHRRIQGPQWC